jgi:hypothetical protein
MADAEKPPKERKPSMRIATPNAVVKKLKFGDTGVTCCLDHLGEDGPECLTEGTIIYINRDHPLVQEGSAEKGSPYPEYRAPHHPGSLLDEGFGQPARGLQPSIQTPAGCLPRKRLIYFRAASNLLATSRRFSDQFSARASTKATSPPISLAISSALLDENCG